VWDDKVEEVVLPSTSGQLGILSNHAPLLTALDIGVMRVRPDKDWKNIVVMGGFAEVDNNDVKVLVNSAELADNIDKETARQAYTEAQNSLNEATKSGDRKAQLKASKVYRQARARYQAAGGLV
jgi:F-type H+-transporting ATPase subunit epsilon